MAISDGLRTAFKRVVIDMINNPNMAKEEIQAYLEVLPRTWEILNPTETEDFRAMSLDILMHEIFEETSFDIEARSN